MKRLAMVLCLISVFCFAAFAEEPAKKAELPTGDELITVEWVHGGDGGNIKVVVFTDGQFIISKTFVPAREGARVPVLPPVTGTMMEKWVNELRKSIVNTDWTKVQAEYKAPEGLPRPADARSADYVITKKIGDKTYKTKVYDCQFNGANIPRDLNMIATIAVILHEVRWK